MRPTVRRSEPGAVLLRKTPGKTSFQSLSPLKRVYGPAVGHTGTLDQFAEGLLVALVGKFTKFNPLFTAFDKVYEADILFGVETDTLDPEGRVVFEGPVDADRILALASSYLGPQLQRPPEYSAVHVDGRRASDRVRDGEVIELAPRPITVHALEVLEWQAPVLRVRIHCSKGTYIRSIARDWGRAAGSGAHLVRLVRTRVGPFLLPEGDQRWLPASEVLATLGLPSVTLETGDLAWVRQGRDPQGLLAPGTEAPWVGLWTPEQRLLAVAERRPSGWGYLFVDPEEGPAP